MEKQISKEPKDVNTRILILKDACARLGVSIKEFHAKSFRLTKNKKTIDVYPKSMRVFFHDCQEWETATDIIRFLEFEFK